MKVRIPKIALSLAVAVPATYAAGHMVRTVNGSAVIDNVLFYAHLPDPLSDVVTNFKMLPERMNPTLSECN